MSSTDAATSAVPVNTDPAPQTQVTLGGKVLASQHFTVSMGPVDK